MVAHSSATLLSYRSKANLLLLFTLSLSSLSLISKAKTVQPQDVPTSILLGYETADHKPLLGDYLNTTVHFNASKEYNVTTFGHAFLTGMQADDFSGNSTTCFDSILYFYYHELPLMQIRYHYGDTDDIVFNTTRLIYNISNHLTVCTNVFEGL